MSAAEGRFHVGQVVGPEEGQRYRVLCLISDAGSFSDVWLAQPLRHDGSEEANSSRPVALKRQHQEHFAAAQEEVRVLRTMASSAFRPLVTLSSASTQTPASAAVPTQPGADVSILSDGVGLDGVGDDDGGDSDTDGAVIAGGGTRGGASHVVCLLDTFSECSSSGGSVEAPLPPQGRSSIPDHIRKQGSMARQKWRSENGPGSASRPKSMVMALEWLGMSLSTLLAICVEFRAGIPIPIIRRLAHDALLGLAQIHERGCVHTDIRPENISCVAALYEEMDSLGVLALNGADDTEEGQTSKIVRAALSRGQKDPFRAKIIDLGNALPLPPCGYIKLRPTDEVCTREYRPPEAVLCGRLDCSADVFSLGCVIYELATDVLLLQTDTVEGQSDDDGDGRDDNSADRRIADIELLKRFEELSGSKFPAVVAGVEVKKHARFDKNGTVQRKDKYDKKTQFTSGMTPAKRLTELLTKDLQRQDDEGKDEEEEEDPSRAGDIAQLAEFLSCCLAIDASQRWSASRLLSHPFLVLDPVTYVDAVSKLVVIDDEQRQDLLRELGVSHPVTRSEMQLDLEGDLEGDLEAAVTLANETLAAETLFKTRPRMKSNVNRFSLRNVNPNVAIDMRRALTATHFFPSVSLNLIEAHSEYGCNRRTLKAGEAVITGGSEVLACFFVINGSCRIESKQSSNNLIPAGSLIGERNFVAGVKTFARSVVAAEDDTEVCQAFSRSLFDLNLAVDCSCRLFVSEWRKHDPDHKGLDHEKLTEFLISSTNTKPSRAQLDRIILTLDTNNGGLVSLTEVLSVLQEKHGANISVEDTSSLSLCLFRNWYAAKHATLFIRSITIQCAFSIVGLLTNLSLSSDASATTDANIWLQSIMLMTISMLFEVVNICQRQPLVAPVWQFFLRHFDLCAGILAWALSTFCLTAATPAGTGPNHLAVLRAAVFVFGFSKLRFWPAVVSYCMSYVSYSVWLHATGILQASIVSSDGAFNHPLLLSIFGCMKPGNNVFSIALLMLIIAGTAVLFATCQAAETSQHQYFQSTMDLLRREQALQKQSEKGCGAGALLLDEFASNPKLLDDVELTSASDPDAQIQSLEVLASELKRAGNLLINPLSGCYRDSHREAAFVKERVLQFKSLFTMTVGLSMGFSLVLTLIYSTGIKQSARPWAFVIQMLLLIPSLVGSISKRTVHVDRCCTVLSSFLFAWWNAEMQGLWMLNVDELQQGLHTATFFASTIIQILVVFTFTKFSWFEKLFVNVFTAAVFCITAMVTRSDLMYDSTRACPRCDPRWTTPNAQWSLGMSKTETIVNIVFFLACGSLSAFRSEHTQRHGAAMAIGREVEARQKASFSEAIMVLRQKSSAQRLCADKQLVAGTGAV